MNTALVFVGLSLALVLLVLAVLITALWRAQAQVSDSGNLQANAQVYRTQRADLEREHRFGHINDSELALAIEELAQRLHADVGTADEPVPVSNPQRPRITVALLAIGFPVLAVLLYGTLGQPLGLDPAAMAQSAPETDAQGGPSPEKLAAMVGQLQQRLQDEPNNIDAWLMLARVERALTHPQQAEKAFAKALSLSADDDIAVERAEVVAQMQQGDFAGEPWSVLLRILKANPNQSNALLLAGSASYSEGRFKDAIGYWERVRTGIAPGTPEAQAVDNALAQARDKLGLKPAASAAGAAPSAASSTAASAPPNSLANSPTSGAVSAAGLGTSTTAPAPAAGTVQGRVSLSPELLKQSAPGDTLFIYATPAQGGRMPLAIIRTTVAALPLNFVLDDSQAMNPAAKLSSVAEVIVKARISKTGQAISQPGDLGVSLGPVKLGTQGLNLIISGPMP